MATRKHARRASEGAVMVEALLAASMLTLMMGCLLFIHRVALADIQSAQEARHQAWHNAMTGCQDQSFELSSMVSDLAAGRLPLPNSFIPSGTAEGSAKKHVSGIMGFSARDVSRVARIPCRSLPVRPPPAPGTWLLDLFPTGA